MAYARSRECVVTVASAPEPLFAWLDDHERLGGHMTSSSTMMMGSAMTFTFDEARGRALGAKIRMNGRVLGLSLALVETVVERDPPRRKVWQTDGTPRLLVIGPYRMGFEIAGTGAVAGSRLRVFIDYDLPPWPWRPLGWLAGGFYARWCVRSMAQDAAARFTAE